MSMGLPDPIPELKLADLKALDGLRAGRPAYYRKLLDRSEAAGKPWVHVGAALALLELDAYPEDRSDLLLALCRYGSIRNKAVAFFTGKGDTDRAARAATIAVAGPKGPAPAKNGAADRLDTAELSAAHLGDYLATGDLALLLRAAEAAELAGGWRRSLPIALMLLLIQPDNPSNVRLAYFHIEAANSAELTEAFAGHLKDAGLFPSLRALYEAAAKLQNGDAGGCLDGLKALGEAKIAANPALAPALGTFKHLRAKALDEIGSYKAAYAAFSDMNRFERVSTVDLNDYPKGLIARGRLPIPDLPAESRHDIILMTGFARSGTTLLENVLEAHPLVETFEETPCLNRAIDEIEQAVQRADTSVLMAPETYLAARRRYYREIERRRQKQDTKILIDKNPMRSGDAVFLKKLFPERQYIFAIRHPFDVVLSCFKQRFVANPAMENFHTIGDAARLYDFVMQQWFSVHTMDDPKVCYVRYDELVTAFEPTVTRVLGFLGLEWSDDVRDFAKKAEERSSRTPSYQKVRQGLSIGVQSAWRNYRFLFDTPHADALRGWVKFFGYEAE